MLDRAFFARYRVAPSPPWERAVAALWGGMERATGTRVTLQNLEALPTSPALIATNSTQKYDFMPLRVALRRRGVRAVTVTKGKNYHQRTMAFLLGRLGVVPLASRGYLLLVDFLGTFGRRCTEEEYRALRSHVDDGAPLPEFLRERLERTPRALLGHAYEPDSSAGGYRAFLHRVYREVMGQTLRLCREAVAQGHHVQMYPEGTVSSRLGEGRIGAVQLAWALRLPIVPAGMSGCRAAFQGQAPLLRGGEIHVRFGEPYSLPSGLLPADFSPFDPAHEARFRVPLQRATAELMDRLDALLAPEQRRRDGFVADGTSGTRRFL